MNRDQVKSFITKDMDNIKIAKKFNEFLYKLGLNQAGAPSSQLGKLGAYWAYEKEPHRDAVYERLREKAE
jgi:hypothetical protein